MKYQIWYRLDPRRGLGMDYASMHDSIEGVYTSSDIEDQHDAMRLLESQFSHEQRERLHIYSITKLDE
jgi:hypothetical protein